jgi:hypothetical protein
MADYIRSAEAIRDAFGCVVIIVHHCGYDESHPRGHTSLPGAVDAQLAIVRVDNTVTVTVEHMRDGVEDTIVTSVSRSVEVGHDRNGKLLTSLVLVPAEAQPFATERNKWPQTLTTFHISMVDALSRRGTPFQHQVGTLPVRAVDLEVVREQFYARYVVGEDDAAARQNTLKKAFQRGLTYAQERNVIEARNDGTRTLVWFKERAD